MKNIKIITLVLVLGMLVFISCKKKYDLPPPRPAIAVSGYITIDSIRARYLKYYQGTAPAPTTWYKFHSDLNLMCTVTADEVSGNIYKTVYVEDSTGTLQISLMASGGLAVGDKIRINLNGCVLNDYAKMVQLDSVDVLQRIQKISSGNPVSATKMTMAQVKSTGPGGLLKYQGKLVLLDTVEFDAGSKGQEYADPIGKYSGDRNLVNASGNLIDVRTSGYAKFAGYIIPCGKGSLAAIVTQYNSTPQLTIRDYSEVKLSSGGCPLVLKTFDDGSVTSGGWSAFNVSGSINWTTASYSGQTYGNITNYVSGVNYACETWMISPPMDISNGSNPRFSFESAYNYSGPTLQVLVSTNYNSGNPTTATWTTLSPTLSSGSWNWTNSGTVSLASFKSANTRIAFKYSGTSSAGSTWEVDNISVFAD
ncbi:MAG: DUF5689 domain-containing protein [Bacteroidia bacterium]